MGKNRFWIDRREKSEEVPNGKEPLQADAMTVSFSRLINKPNERERIGSRGEKRGSGEGRE
jgi:hypothetical protein